MDSLLFLLLQLLYHPLTLSIFLIFIFLLFKHFLFLSNSSKTLLPSPPKLPIFGNLLNLGSYPHITLQTYAQRHGSLFLAHFGSVPIIVVSSADIARDIMKTHDLVFSDRPKSSLSDKLLYNSRVIATSAYGEYWRQMKSIAVVHLLSNKRVQSFRSVREEEIKLMIQKIRENPLRVNLSEMFSGVTNDVVCRVAVGRKYGEGEDEKGFRNLLMELMKLLGTFTLRDFIPLLGWVDYITGLDAKIERVAKEFDAFLEKVIKEHMDFKKRGEDEEQKDLVDILLWLQRENLAGFPLEMVNIKAILLDVFAAGIDTTYTVMEWAMTRLLKHPRVMKKLQSEVREIAANKTYVSEEDIEKMHYLKAVIKETLRLHPPIPLLVPRESTQDIKLKGYDIKGGSRIMINAWAIGRDPKWWEEAEEFRPERFMNNGIDYKGHDFQLIPFGAGRRGCPGIVFATAINEVVLANVVLNFEWSLGDGVKAEDLDMTQVFALAIHRKFPLVAVANSYSPPSRKNSGVYEEKGSVPLPPMLC